MTYPIGDNSPQAAAQHVGDVAQRKQAYPWQALRPGLSFAVPIAEANVPSLRTRCSQLSINGKRYTVVVHTELGVVEVAQLPDRIVGTQTAYSIGPNSPQAIAGYTP